MANIINGIIWFIVLFAISFIVAGFCAPFYIILFPLQTCISALSGINDLLLTGIQFPGTCAQNMMGCKGC